MKFHHIPVSLILSRHELRTKLNACIGRFVFGIGGSTLISKRWVLECPSQSVYGNFQSSQSHWEYCSGWGSTYPAFSNYWCNSLSSVIMEVVKPVLFHQNSNYYHKSGTIVFSVGSAIICVKHQHTSTSFIKVGFMWACYLFLGWLTLDLKQLMQADEWTLYSKRTVW